MRSIEKGPEPASLRQHRKDGGSYDTYRETDDLRRALLRDQGHICGYCMARITLRSMKNEHWASQSDHDQTTVDWSNLLGVCRGGDGERGAIKQCDTARGKTPLKVNPLDRAQRCERHIGYRRTGEMFSPDPEIDRDIQVVLNLNNIRLKRARQRVLDILVHRLGAEEVDYWPRRMLEDELESWRARDDDGMYLEYCQIAVYFLEKLLKRRT